MDFYKDGNTKMHQGKRLLVITARQLVLFWSFLPLASPCESRMSTFRKCNRSVALASFFTRSRLSSHELSNVSTTITLYGAAVWSWITLCNSSSKHVWDPMYPAPPVTNTVRDVLHCEGDEANAKTGQLLLKDNKKEITTLLRT